MKNWRLQKVINDNSDYSFWAIWAGAIWDKIGRRERGVLYDLCLSSPFELGDRGLRSEDSIKQISLECVAVQQLLCDCYNAPKVAQVGVFGRNADVHGRRGIPEMFIRIN